MLCGIVGIEYTESLFASLTSGFCVYGGVVIPNTPLSFNVACFLEYGYMGILVMTILSFAIETCNWNKYANYYLLVNLFEKDFITMPLELCVINTICIANSIIIAIILWHGFTILLKIHN